LPGIQISGSFMSNIGGAGIHIDLPPGVGGRAFRNEDVLLTDLITTDDVLLDHMSFADCRIFGPAVLVLIGGSQLMNSNLGGPPNAVLWPLPDPNAVVGGIVAHACTFDRCEFINVGFGLPPEQIPSVRASLER
jgi:hypothetical protein